MKKSKATGSPKSNTAEKRDILFSRPSSTIKDFEFNHKVATVFDDMISRSVPEYGEAQMLTAKIAVRFFQPGSCIYDLGCSTGTTLLLICQALSNAQGPLYGIDNSPAMLEECRRKLEENAYRDKVTLLETDIRKVMPGNASVIILNYTLQFIPPGERLDLIKRFYSSIVPGGCLILSEKVAHPDETIQSCITDMHLDFKRGNGYSELEIAQKRDALENVLIPFSSTENISLLEQAGFDKVENLLRCLNFCTYLAVKSS